MQLNEIHLENDRRENHGIDGDVKEGLGSKTGSTDEDGILFLALHFISFTH